MRLVRLRHAESDVEVEETLWQIVAALVKRPEAPSRAVAWTLLGLPALICMLQMVRLDDFREDPRWVGRRVNVSPRRAIVGLAFLARAGLVARDKGGRLRAVDATVHSGGSDTRLAARFARLNVLAAQRAAPRNWRPHLFWKVEGPLSAAQAQELLDRAAAINTRLQKALLALERSPTTLKDRVVQIQYQVFPQLPMKPKRRRKKKPSGE